MNEKKSGWPALQEIAQVFLTLGCTAFGGPAAHIALMNREIVEKRSWVSRQYFLDLLSVTNLIPGPNSTEMAIHLGHVRGGWRGLLLAGVCFILPAASIVTLIAWAYMRFGSLPVTHAMLYGIKPVIIAVILQALWGLGRSALKSPFLAVLALAAFLVNFVVGYELLILGGAALLAWIEGRRQKGAVAAGLGLFALARPGPAFAAFTAGIASVSLGGIFLFFLKIGSVLFGSGYVLVAFLRADLVEHWHWLSENQLLDAIAVGQFTPGPVFTTATFVGYVLAGFPGAFLATLGIFLPAFIFVVLTAPLVAKLRSSGFSAALDGLNVASFAIMGVATVKLAGAAVVGWFTLALAAVSFVLLVRWRINSAWLVLAGAALSLLLYFQ